MTGEILWLFVLCLQYNTQHTMLTKTFKPSLVWLQYFAVYNLITGVIYGIRSQVTCQIIWIGISYNYALRCPLKAGIVYR